MAFFYEIRSTSDAVLKRTSGYPDRDAATVAAREDAKKLRLSKHLGVPMVGKILPGAPTARSIFDAVDIVNGLAISPLVGGSTTQGLGANSTITLNPSGPFYNSSGIVNGESIQLRIGSFSGGTIQAQKAVLFHEFAHDVNAIPPDGTDPKRSGANTNTILQVCQAQIK